MSRPTTIRDLGDLQIALDSLETQERLAALSQIYELAEAMGTDGARDQLLPYLTGNNSLLNYLDTPHL